MSSTPSSDDERPLKRRKFSTPKTPSKNKNSTKTSKPKPPVLPDIPDLQCNPFLNKIDHKISVFFFKKVNNFDKLTNPKVYTDELQKFLVDRKFFESRTAKSRRSRGCQHFMTTANVNKSFATQGAFIQCTIRIKHQPDIGWLLVQREFNKSPTLTDSHTCSLWLTETAVSMAIKYEEALQRAIQVMDLEFEKYRTQREQFRPLNSKIKDYMVTMARVGKRIASQARSDFQLRSVPTGPRDLYPHPPPES